MDNDLPLFSGGYRYTSNFFTHTDGMLYRYVNSVLYRFPNGETGIGLVVAGVGTLAPPQTGYPSGHRLSNIPASIVAPPNPAPPIITPPIPPIITPPIPPIITPPIPPIITPPVVILPEPPRNIGVGKVYFKIDDTDKLQESIVSTYSMWGDDLNMNRFFTSSILTQGTGSRLYNLEVRNYVETDCRSKVKFNIAYGHFGGSGSRDLGGYDYLSPSKAIYGQAKSLCLESSQSKFIFNGMPTDSIYVLNVKRAYMGDRMDEGNWELNLHHLSGSEFDQTKPRNAHTGSNVKLGYPGKITRLIDDSRISSPNVTSIGEVYKIVSGSLEQGVHNISNPVQYGLFYPKLGMLIFDGTKLDSACSFLSVTGSDVAGDNAVKLFKSISGSARYTDASGDILGFYARKQKTLHRDTYFVRVKNQDCNFSNNPTYVTGSDALLLNDFKGNPTSYITTIGLYNDRKELLAISKLSKPIAKTFTEESMFTVRIKYGD